VGYNFPIDDKGYRKDIDEFLKKVFPDKELRKYVLHQQAQALSGMKGNDCVYTHSGKGSNGKSIEIIIFIVHYTAKLHQLTIVIFTILYAHFKNPEYKS
jgi:phage/plasmid-associated DNA primase